MAYQKGQSGNPAGKPPGTPTKVTKLRASIEAHIPEILIAMAEAAKNGDVQAARLLLDRTLPAIKPVDTTIHLPMSGDLAADGRAILVATGNADLTPEQAGRLLAGIGALAKIVETDEMLRRIEILEQKANGDDSEQA